MVISPVARGLRQHQQSKSVVGERGELHAATLKDALDMYLLAGVVVKSRSRGREHFRFRAFT
jgi:hypothetical protein